MRNTFSYLFGWKFFLVLTLLTSGSCQNWDLEPANFPLVSTGENPVPDAGNATYTFSGSISGLGSEETLVQFGHVLLETEGEPSLDAYDYRLDESGIGNQSQFETQISGLSPEQTYFFRAFAIVNGAPYYGKTYSFQLPQLNLSLSILDIANIVQDPDGSSADVSYEISGLPESGNGLKVWGVGLTWSDQPGPDPRNTNFLTQGAITIPGPTQAFTVQMLNLAPGSYYLRAYLQVGNAFYFSEESCFHIGGFWRKRSDIPQSEGLSRATSFSLKGKGYVLGGENSSGVHANLWEYDPDANTWAQKKDFPGGPREYMTSFSIDTLAYAGLGKTSSGAFPTSFFRYNPYDDNWSPISDYPSNGRIRTGTFSLAGKGYVGGGNNNQVAFVDFRKFDAQAGQWSAAPSLPSGEICVSPVAFSIGNKGYVGFGEFWDGSSNSSFYQIQDGENWVHLGNFSLPNTLYGPPLAGTATSEKGYAVGEFLENTFVDHFFEYDPIAKTWTSKTYIPMEGSNRIEGVFLSIRNKIYFGLGKGSGTNFSTLFEYTPEEGCD